MSDDWQSRVDAVWDDETLSPDAVVRAIDELAGELPADEYDEALAKFLDDPSAFGDAPEGGDKPAS